MTSVTEWQQALRAADLPLATKGLLFTLSTYADWTTGEHIRPGKKLQDDCHISRTQAYEHIKVSSQAGWLVKTGDGSTAPKRNWANEYRLAIPDHVRDSERDRPTMFGIPNDHVRDSEPHLTSPNHVLPRHDDEPPSGENRAKVEVVPWDGDVSRLVIPSGFDPGAREYYVRPDGTIRPVRGLPRPGEVRATLDLRDIKLSRAIQAELASFRAQRAGK